MPVHFRFDNSYVRLPERLYARLDPTPVAAPRLVRVNSGLAESLGLDPEELVSPEGIEILSGNRIPEGAALIALAYAGHQFGNFVPQLGDGRAILLGEIVGQNGGRHDIQLKGSGQTPYSRDGDGRAALGPVLREYIVSEAMAALGVPTTRALAAVTTGESVRRETMLPGAILTRVAASHIRIGTFQFVAAQGNTEVLRLLADYVIARHYPQVETAQQPYRALLDAVVARQADLIARWMLIGFIHGVMNTDNTSIAGETIDYGPCAFLDRVRPCHRIQFNRPFGPLCLWQPAKHWAVEPRTVCRDAAAAAGGGRGSSSGNGEGVCSVHSPRVSSRPISQACNTRLVSPPTARRMSQ